MSLVFHIFNSIYLLLNVSQRVPGVAVEIWNGSLSPASQVTALAS